MLEKSETSGSIGPSAADRDKLRRTYRGARTIGFIMLGLAYVAGVLVLMGELHARAFNDDQNRVNAFVVARAHGRYGDQIHVVYTTGNGDVEETRIPVDSADDFQPASNIVIVVDPRNPRHVRTLEGWTAPWQQPLIFGVIFLFIGLIVFLALARWTRRLWRTAIGGQPHQVLLSWVSTPGARGSTAWRALLWDPLHPPPADPILQFRVLEPEGEVGAVETATVVGDLKPRGVLVAKDASGFVWPMSTARRLNRAARKALSQVHIPSAAASSEEGLPVPAMDKAPETHGLPPEFFTRQKESKSRDAIVKVARVAAALAVGFGVPLLIANHVSHPNSCPQLPALSSLPTSVSTSDDSTLLSIIRRLPVPSGFTETQSHTFVAQELVPPTRGFRSGAEVLFTGSNGDRLALSVLQFDSADNARRHWAGTWVEGCAFHHTNLTIPGAPAARAISLFRRDGGFDDRAYFVRNGRLYLVHLVTQRSSPDELQADVHAVIASNL